MTKSNWRTLIRSNGRDMDDRLLETVMAINSSIFKHRTYRRIVCADGASVSIQAGECPYSTPRNNYGPYTHIEAGFPSVEPPTSWRDYAEDPDALTETVYGWMPWVCVDEFINVHGGLVEGIEADLPPRA